MSVKKKYKLYNEIFLNYIHNFNFTMFVLKEQSVDFKRAICASILILRTIVDFLPLSCSYLTNFVNLIVYRSPDISKKSA